MKVVCLMSGGIDSPVAAYLMMKAGADVVGLHFDNRPFTDDRETEKAFKLMERLEELTGRTMRKLVLPHGFITQVAIARSLSAEGARGLQCVLCRRMMWRAASEAGKMEGAQALVTGESLGQVASQTLLNIHAETDAATLPILRPLLGLDKTEIMELARKIGTYEISTLPGICCTIVPDHPETHADLNVVLEKEEKVGVPALMAKVMAGMSER